MTAPARKRGGNPVPASRFHGQPRAGKNAIEKAAKLYRNFTGNEPHETARSDAIPDRAYLDIGTVDGILYTTSREGKPEQYIHHFRPRSRPKLLVSHDGKEARTLGGRFTFTERGFVDEDASGNAVE